MPQPINKIVPSPDVFLDAKILADKPDMAALVCEIFAVWAKIEQELNFLFFLVLGADAAPAIAIYSELKTQQLQNVSLEAAAKAALSAEDYEYFKAAITVANGAQTPRNHLAHWSWGGCRQRPDLLALANPQMLRERDFRVAKHFAAKGIEEIDPMEVVSLHLFDDSAILAYSKADLERSLRDLREADFILAYLRAFLNPKTLAIIAKSYQGLDASHAEIRAAILEKLNDQRLFREALAQIRASRKSTLQMPSGPHPPGSGAS
jgi:Xaa-Pro aminopeptidase